MAKDKEEGEQDSKKEKKKRKKDVSLSELSEPNLTARRYANINASYPNPKEKYDVDNMKVPWGDFGDYEINWDKELGRGSYGQVLLGKKKSTGQVVAIKAIFPDKEKEIYVQNELKMLMELREGPEIVHLIDIMKNPENDQKMIVLEFIKNPAYKYTYEAFRDIDARIYLYLLLSALDYAHSKGIMHRDVKGGNVLYNPKKQQLRLVDWGFGAFYLPEQQHAKWMGTRRYKSPEMFLHYTYIDYAADMWGFGCILARVIMRRSLFRPTEDTDVAMMAAIARYLGTYDYQHYIRKYKPFLRRREYYTPERMQRHCDRKLRSKRVRWDKYINDKNRDLAVPDAIDLLDQLMLWDHEKRLTAPEALKHRYFDPVRELVIRQRGCCCPGFFGRFFCSRDRMHDTLERNAESDSPIDFAALSNAIAESPGKPADKNGDGKRASDPMSSSTPATAAVRSPSGTTATVTKGTEPKAAGKAASAGKKPDSPSARDDAAAGVGDIPHAQPEVAKRGSGKRKAKHSGESKKARPKPLGTVGAAGADRILEDLQNKARKRAREEEKKAPKKAAKRAEKKDKKEGRDGKGRKKKAAVGVDPDYFRASNSSFNLGRRPHGTSVMTVSSTSSAIASESCASASTGQGAPKSFLQSMMLRREQQGHGRAADPAPLSPPPKPSSSLSYEGSSYSTGSSYPAPPPRPPQSARTASPPRASPPARKPANRGSKGGRAPKRQGKRQASHSDSALALPAALPPPRQGSVPLPAPAPAPAPTPAAPDGRRTPPPTTPATPTATAGAPPTSARSQPTSASPPAGAKSPHMPPAAP